MINALMKWLESTVKMCLLLIILRPESFVETGVRDLENELFFQDHSRNNFVVIFELELFLWGAEPVNIPYIFRWSVGLFIWSTRLFIWSTRLFLW